MKKFYVALLLALFCVFAGGTTVSAEPSARAKILMKNAEKGDAEAQFGLGFAYYFGKEGGRRDYHKAKKWYEKAAKQGHTEAQYYLGTMYAEGEGVRQDYHKAKEWYEKSAKQGNAFSQHSLGVMYENGLGVRQNLSEAKEWYGKACDNGYQKGCEDYARLNRGR